MRVSFDLDEVLFVDPKRFEIEPPPRGLAGIFYKERLRKGTVELMHRLQSEGFEIWVYTSSYRSVQYITNLFRQYDIRFDGIVNAQRHEREVQREHRQRLPQKMPSYFRISLHIDDEENIVRSSRSFGFRSLKVCEPDDQWAEKVFNEAVRIRELEGRQKEMRSRARKEYLAGEAK